MERNASAALIPPGGLLHTSIPSLTLPIALRVESARGRVATQRCVSSHTHTMGNKTASKENATRTASIPTSAVNRTGPWHREQPCHACVSLSEPALLMHSRCGKRQTTQFASREARSDNHTTPMRTGSGGGTLKPCQRRHRRFFRTLRSHRGFHYKNTHKYKRFDEARALDLSAC
jgi:hypothetical protein